MGPDVIVAPRAGARIETLGAIEVAPRAGARIETDLASARSPPVRGRGLKLSPPVRGRGLKRCVGADFNGRVASPPRAGARIETRPRWGHLTKRK